MKIRLLKETGDVIHLDLEEYLRGVIASEIPLSFHDEAVKAVTVAARSYAVFWVRRGGRHDNADLCSSQHCQAWVESTHHYRIDSLIEQTRGEIVFHNGSVVEALYSADCSGRTLSALEVFGKDIPYLQSVDCPAETGEVRGHRVGLCQAGADVLARRGFSYEEILQHYYSDVYIGKLEKEVNEVFRGHKFGLHSIGPDKVVDFVSTLAETGHKLAVVKAVYDISWLKQVKQIAPETVTVGRFTGFDTFPKTGDPRTRAFEQMSKLLSRAAGHFDYVDYWEPMNEDNPPELEQHQFIAEVMKECMKLADEEGIKLAIFSYALGTPHIEFIEPIVDTGVFEVAKQGGHILALHEGTLEAPANAPTAVPWLNTRYRFWYDVLKERDLVIPLIISEWINGSYAAFPGTPEEWADQLIWYLEELQKDDYVIGVTPFTLTWGPWADYVYVDSVSYLLDYVRSFIPEAEEREYASHYVLFPQGTSWDWYEAAKSYFLRFRVTRGESADDAVRRWGTTNVLTAINPSSEVLQFIRENLDEASDLDLVRLDLDEFKQLFDWRAQTGNRFGWPEKPVVGRVGLCARNDFHLYDPDIELVKEARLEAIKFFQFTDPVCFDRIREFKPDILAMVRLYSFGLAEQLIWPEQFVDEVSEGSERWLAKGVTFFEVHNEPNIEGGFETPEAWEDWFCEVVYLLRERFPEGKWGYPGLSPAANDIEWLNGSVEAVNVADFLCCHCYWTNEAQLTDTGFGERYKLYHLNFPDKELYITEFSNPAEGPVPEQYLEWLRRMKESQLVVAAFSFIMSSPDPAWHKEAWRHEDGGFKPIVFAVGQRDF